MIWIWGWSLSQLLRCQTIKTAVLSQQSHHVSMTIFVLEFYFVLQPSKMVRIVVFAALGWLPTTLGGFNTIGEEACPGHALGYLAGDLRKARCIENIASQASEFCSSYLSLPATSLATTFQFNTVTKTFTEILTSGTTAITTSTSSSVTTTTTISTSIITSATGTTTVATSYVPPPPFTVTVGRRDNPKCPDLPIKQLSHLPAALLSSACRCLGTASTTTVLTRTVVASATTTTSTTRTTTSTTTSTTIEILVSTATTTSPTTSTSGTVATETAVVDYCSVTYNGGGVTPGNIVIRPPGDLNGYDCCVLCWSTPNCVASAVGVGFCQLLVKVSPLTGAPTSPQCPLGIENYQYLPGPGTLYRGPCSPGLN